jgi:hypothetical protein
MAGIFAPEHRPSRRPSAQGGPWRGLASATALRRTLVILTVSVVAVIGCGNGDSNDDIDGTCLPPAAGAVPLVCGKNCSCGTGGKCENGQCLSCNCNNEQGCNPDGSCYDIKPSRWYSRTIGAYARSTLSPHA